MAVDPVHAEGTKARSGVEGAYGSAGMSGETPSNPGQDVEFVSEPIEPEAGTFSTDLMTQGLAALPRAFRWRSRRYEIVACLGHVKQSVREGHTPRGEAYLRRQAFDVRLDSGQTATIYVQRRVASGSSGRRRWFLYTISSRPPATGGDGGRCPPVGDRLP
jgi:hypothetical protein